MRTYLAIVLGVTVFVCGCVPKADLDEALAANRKLKQEIGNKDATLNALRGEKDDLAERLEAAEQLVKRSEEMTKNLQATNESLKGAYEKLKADYRDYLDKRPPLGPVSIQVLPKEIDEALKGFASANPDLIEYSAGHGMVKLKSDLTFAKGSDDVQEAARQALAKLAEILSTPEAAKFNVFIAGHTDDIPIVRPQTRQLHKDNWYLSVHRAVSVQETLVSAGLAPQRICCMGFGEYHPIEPNSPNRRGNPANRRVEIWILPQDRFLTTSASVSK